MSDTSVADRPVVLVGAGRWGSVHARQWSKICTRAPLIIVDLDANRSEALALKHQALGCTYLSEAMEMLSGLPTPLISVVTPVVSLDEVVLAASQLSPLIFVEKPGISKEIGARGAVGYIERFNPVRPHLITSIQRAVSTQSSVHLETTRLSEYAPETTSAILDDLFCHDLDLLLEIFRACGYEFVSLSDVSADLITTHRIEIRLSAIFNLINERNTDVIRTRPSSVITHPKFKPMTQVQVKLKSIAGRGARLRSWRVNEEHIYHLNHYATQVNPLYKQCEAVYAWSQSPHHDLPHPLCSIKESVQRVTLLRRLAHQLSQ